MAAEPSLHVLHFVTGKYEGAQWPLEAGKSFIAGRSTEADLVLADDAVSRKHARFFDHRGRHWVRDLGSRNGTLVNGKAAERHCLREGDRLTIGSSLIRVQVLESAGLGKRAGEPARRSPAESAGRSMTGSIEDIPLVDVLQWLATSRKTGTLKVRNTESGRMGGLHLRDGQVFYATIEGTSDLHPEKAVLRMLAWAKGMFELDNSAAESPPTEISMSLEYMLMEAARQSDELAALSKRATLPTQGASIEVVRPSPVPWKELEDHELDLMQMLTDQPMWFDLLDSTKLDDVTLSKTLVSLQKKGVVKY